MGTDVETINVAVKLRWLPADPEEGERLGMIILPGGDPDEVKRARAVLGDALGDYRTWNGLSGQYRISLRGLRDLRTLANRWPSLAEELHWFEEHGSLKTHVERHGRWERRRWRDHLKQQRQQAYEELYREFGDGPWQQLFGAQQAKQTSSTSPRTPQPRLPVDIAAAFAELGLLPTLRVWLIGAVRRAFQRKYHPDSGSKSANLALSQHYNRQADLCTAWAYAERRRRGEQDGDESD